MKKTYVYLTALLISITACKKEEVKTETSTTDTTTVAKEEMPAEAEKPMDSIAMQKAWEAYATPGEMHKRLAADNGTWNEEMTFWMGPDAKPQKSTAVAQNKMIFNGLYQESTHKGMVMGMPFEGKSTVGFDNAAQEYVSTWIDNMGSGIMMMKGKYDAASKTVNMSGECVDPMTKAPKKIREVWTVVDENTQKMEMFDTANGKEYKSMEIVMTRKK
ncbi:DUF1579 domain-containing protein [Flavobacterium pallidum]|uniref:DUF1579 domain-containing protein n=1 Tax=Flavobacterium pallidum TaxID=2172098 RepID=A0A2S1SJT0_9FLAO|nr:DUF1579 domain-containing protein [Flavobacterium pallidum]AWI26635.1 hypothetical protein HYN49_12415 [Flavobacterium pallidum]